MGRKIAETCDKNFDFVLIFCGINEICPDGTILADLGLLIYAKNLRH